MTKKILFCASVDTHFRAFHLPVMEWFKREGWEVHAAASGGLRLPFVDRKFDLPIRRSPLKPANVRAYRELKRLIDKENYDLIHGHTPVGGVLARLAARGARRKGTKVLYTAHGFHFYKGAPPANWLLYYPIERWLAGLTDCLITINKEDRARAARSFRACRIERVHGVGVDTARFVPADPERKRQLRASFHYTDEHFLLICAAEFNANKNHELLLHAMAKLKPKVPQARLLLAGEGPLLGASRELAAKLGIAETVAFLGYRTDMETLLSMCDVAVSASLREGLPVNIMEAMACGLPVVATSNRGHDELVEEGVNGFLVPSEDAAVFASRLHLLHAFAESRLQMGEAGAVRAGAYSLEKVREELARIYQSLTGEAAHEAENQYRRAYI